MAKKLTLSLIIPAFNEEANLAACLDSVANQTVQPDEVIVVDNNSTDRTIDIAKRFRFVKLLHQPKQGLIPARDLGFNSAQSDILGRINADVALAPDWVERVLQNFREQDITGLTGLAQTNLIYTNRWQGTLWSRMYFWWDEIDFGIPILWGANMAIKRSEWLKIKHDACNDDNLVHEDQDLSILIAAHGGRVKLDNHLLVRTEGTAYHDWSQFWEYTRRRYRTMIRHHHFGKLQTAREHRGVALWRRFLVAVALLVPGLIFIGTSLIAAIPNLFRRRSTER